MHDSNDLFCGILLQILKRIVCELFEKMFETRQKYIDNTNDQRIESLNKKIFLLEI